MAKFTGGGTGMSATIQIRPATVADLPGLLRLEEMCFETDRMSRRSFRHFLQQEQPCFLVAESAGQAISGYILVLLHRGTHLARIYSVAVEPAARGQGIAGLLIQAAEQVSAELGRISMRLEVRKDNTAATQVYQRLGYRLFGEYHDYYEDHADALRLQKRILRRHGQRTRMDVPYYAQTTDFTCGPAALMMAMAALEPAHRLDQTEELRLWRESTTIYMMAGHGGCSPVGLAVAAIQRGFQAEVFLSSTDTPFIDSVRGDGKKHVIGQVHQDFLHQLSAANGVLHYENITQVRLHEALTQGVIPLVLISTYRFDRKKVPHWVTVVKMDEQFIYIHDPFINEPDYRSALDNQYLPISRQDFDKMSQFGQMRLRTAVLVQKRE
jgi:ribosomal protein S18 acetylase RimI-like enzyme